MSLAFVAAGSVVAGTNQVLPDFPAGIVAGQLLVMSVASKYAAPTVPAGWTLAKSTQGGSGASGADTGQVFATAMVRIADGTESGTVTVNIPSGNSATARILSYSKSAAKTWAYSAVSGSDNTGGTTWAVTAGQEQAIRSGDLVLAISALNADTFTLASAVIAAAGSTFGASQSRVAASTAQGDDCRLYVHEQAVTAGNSAVAPSFTATASGSTADAPTGATILLRLREVDPRPNEAVQSSIVDSIVDPVVA